MSEQEVNKIEARVAELYNAKKAEEQAKKARVEAEEAVAAALGGPENGSRTFTTGTLKVTIKRGFNYKVSDMEAFKMAYPALVKTTIKDELDAKAYELAIASGPTDATEFVSVTPKKVSVELKM
jgi:hypothetical protein